MLATGRIFKQFFLYLLAISTAVVCWEGVRVAFAVPEAWDSRVYFTSAIPLMVAVSFALGLLSPTYAWRWGLLVVLPQPILMLARKTGAFWIVGLFFFAMFAVPCIVASTLGGALRNYLARRSPPRLPDDASRAGEPQPPGQS